MTSTEEYSQSVDFKRDIQDLGVLRKTIRKQQKLSQRDLYIRSGVTFSHICNMENGKTGTTFITISKLFNALGYTVAEAYLMLPD